jgi:hypothetical protein
MCHPAPPLQKKLSGRRLRCNKNIRCSTFHPAPTLATSTPTAFGRGCGLARCGRRLLPPGLRAWRDPQGHRDPKDQKAPRDPPEARAIQAPQGLQAPPDPLAHQAIQGLQGQPLQAPALYMWRVAWLPPLWTLMPELFDFSQNQQ